MRFCVCIAILLRGYCLIHRYAVITIVYHHLLHHRFAWQLNLATNLHYQNISARVFLDVFKCFTKKFFIIAGYSILRVRATDLDEGVNSEIEYEIEAGATKDSFTIESNGDIKTSKPFDREQHPIHTLVVVAKDKGKPSLRGKTNVEITVIDENDNAPVIDQVKSSHLSLIRS